MDCCDDSMAMDRIVCPKPRPVGPSNLNSVMPLRFHIRNDAVAFDSKSGNELPDLIHRKVGKRSSPAAICVISAVWCILIARVFFRGNEKLREVDSVNKNGILLHVVQVLTDLNLVIKKAYISSDGGWFMDVFNVIDRDGEKFKDQKLMNYIQKRLESDDDDLVLPLKGVVGLMPSEEHTCIELTGTDRPGLLSEVCAVFADLHCNVVNAEIWTHNTRAAAVVHVKDDITGFAIEDPNRLSLIKGLLRSVLKGNNDLNTAKMMLSPPGVTHRERRLHQIMFADRDYEKVKGSGEGYIRAKSSRPHVIVADYIEKDYTVITMRSNDRPKLLFDTVCTLTDMQYVVYHGVVHTGRMEAYQEYYIRHVDGVPISSEAERERVNCDAMSRSCHTKERL
ncbi:ACT domain-containing protein acr6 [Castilleja foliolosa]|uniref:ACT domain-containing protein ACR n=1 Tax=Castilleja foliolosa TaxID=1961234 RepID=A0ABD3BER7_9LAMI